MHRSLDADWIALHSVTREPLATNGRRERRPPDPEKCRAKRERGH